MARSTNTKISNIAKAEKRIEEILNRQRQREANRNEKIAELEKMIDDCKRKEQQAIIDNEEQAYKDARLSREFAENRLDAMKDFSVSLTADERTQIIDEANTALAAASLETREALKPLLDEVIAITQAFHAEAWGFHQRMNSMGFQVNAVTGGSASKEVKAGYEVERMFRF